MGGFNNISGFGSGGSGSFPEIAGNGLVVHTDGMLHTVELIGNEPVRIENQDGRQGYPIIRGAPPNTIAWARVSGNSIIDQPMKVINKVKYDITGVVFTGASLTPIALQGGVYTGKDKTGNVLVPNTTLFTSLIDADKRMRIAVDLGEQSRAPWIYVSFTTANAAPNLELNCYVIGTILEFMTA